MVSCMFFSASLTSSSSQGSNVRYGNAAKKEAMYAYEFEGRRYDVGDKLGFLEATVDFALKKPELQGPFMEYLKKVCSERTVEKEVALSAELTSEDDNTEK